MPLFFSFQTLRSDRDLGLHRYEFSVVSGKKPVGHMLPTGFNLTIQNLMFKSAVKTLVFTCWIGCDGQTTNISACAQIVVIPPSIGVVQGEVDSGSQVVCRRDTAMPCIFNWALNHIVIDQVRIERKLLGVLIPDVDLPIISSSLTGRR